MIEISATKISGFISQSKYKQHIILTTIILLVIYLTSLINHSYYTSKYKSIITNASPSPKTTQSSNNPTQRPQSVGQIQERDTYASPFFLTFPKLDLSDIDPQNDVVEKDITSDIIEDYSREISSYIGKVSYDVSVYRYANPDFKREKIAFQNESERIVFSDSGIGNIINDLPLINKETILTKLDPIRVPPEWCGINSSYLFKSVHNNTVLVDVNPTCLMINGFDNPPAVDAYVYVNSPRREKGNDSSVNTLHFAVRFTPFDKFGYEIKEHIAQASDISDYQEYVNTNIELLINLINQVNVIPLDP